MQSWSCDDADAYGRLRAMAHALMRGERRNHTLTPTALVHEALLRMAAVPARTADPGLGAMHLTMQRVLLDHARGRARQKRQATRGDETAAPDALGALSHTTTVTSIREALQRLQEMSPERAQVWEAHYLLGHGTDEIAAVRGCSQRNVQIWLRAANAFLRVCLAGGE